MNKTVAIEAFGIILIMIILSITFLTNFRTCEILENGQVKQISCAEVGAIAK